MAKEEKKIKSATIDESLPNVDEKDFVFVQMDKTIHDIKFQTKPTTFFKDALIRFSKNRSSVVAAILIGILMLMAIFVPIFNDSNLTSPFTDGRFLPPKWHGFENAGILDGYRDYENIVIDVSDPDDPTPVGYLNEAVIGPIDTYEDTTNAPSEFAYGGALALRPDTRSGPVSLMSPNFFINKLNSYEFAIDFTDRNAQLTPVPVYALYLDVRFEGTVFTPVLLKAKSSDFGLVNVSDIKDRLTLAIPSGNENFSFQSRFRIELDTVSEGDYPALFIKSFIAANSLNAGDDTFDELNFDDANELLMRDKIEAKAAGRWNTLGSGSKTLFEGTIIRGNFTYNPYAEVFGEKERVIGETRLMGYVQQGLIAYDFAVGPSSFELLDDASPVRSVISQKSITGGGLTVREVTAVVSMYRFYGFDEMPYYTFGTNQYGYDYFKQVFSGLRTSLIIGFLGAMINITIGLIWGSISGYYGGNIDLAMERIIEILGGIPWIVLMTMVILHLGNSLSSFLIAVTLTGWLGVSGITRSQFYRYKRREYVLASRTLGAKDGRLIFRHILPNSIGPIVTSTVLMIPGIIFAEATISYLGLGLQGLPSLGVALSEVQTYLSTSPYLVLWGSVVISILMISFNLFGNGLRDAFNPSLKGIAE